VIGGVVFVNGARAIGVQDNADPNLAAVLLGWGTEWGGGQQVTDNGKSYAGHID
jgi:hypothetical protein